jgi:hypothetical protein
MTAPGVLARAEAVVRLRAEPDRDHRDQGASGSAETTR